MKRIAIYARKSQDNKDRETSSIEIQVLRGQELAKSLGLEPVLYIEDTSSGILDLEDRPIFWKMIQDLDVKDSSIKTVYAYDPSRLFRNDKTKYQFMGVVQKYNIELYFNNGKYDYNNPHEELAFDILSSTNKFFVQLTSIKIKDTLREKAKQGKANGSVLPYGFTKDQEGYLILDKEESEIIRHIFNSFLEGQTSTQIRNWLIDNNIPTRYNKIGGTTTTIHKGRNETRVSNKKDATWTNGTILQILRNPIYKGKRIWREEFFDVPITIDPLQWEKANQSFINRNKGSLRGKNTEHKYLLSPLLQCICGKSIIGRSNIIQPYYGCAGKRYKESKCTTKYIPDNVLDGFITYLVFGGLYDKVKVSFSGDNVSKRKEIGQALSNVQKEIDRDKQNLIRVENDYTDGTFSKETYIRQRKRIEDRIRDNQIKESNINQTLSTLQGDTNILEDLYKSLLLPLVESVPENYTKHMDYIAKGELGVALPFEVKQNTIRKYISNILINWIPKQRRYQITVSYKLPIPDEMFLMDSLTLHIVDAEQREIVWAHKERFPRQRQISIDKAFRGLMEHIII